MCGGVLIGFAAIKLSGSPNKFGAKMIIEKRTVNSNTKPKTSFTL